MCYNKSKMERYLFLVLLYLIGVTISRSQEESTTYMVQSRTTWTSAIQSCNKKGGSLLTDVENEAYVLNKLSLTNRQFEDDWQKLGSQEFWIKEYKYKSPWISVKGCFSGLPSDTSTTVTSQSNTVGTCYQRCSHYDYFATQGNSCTCLTKTEIESFTEENGVLCNITCPGDVRERCGGSGVCDVYQKMDIHPYQEPNCQQSQDCDCVGLRCNNSTLIYFNDVCRNPHKSVCPIEDSVIIGEPITWSNSLDFCVSLVKRYPMTALTTNHVSTVCNNDVWLGIFRLTLASKGIITCPYCTLVGMNSGDLTCNVTDCHLNRTSICRYKNISSKWIDTPDNGSNAIWPYLFCFLLIPLVIGVCFFYRSGAARIRDNRSDLSQQHSHSNIATGEDDYDLARPMQYDMDNEFNEDNYNHLQRNTPIWGSDVMIAQDYDVSIPTVSGQVHDPKMETANISNAIYEEYQVDMI